VTAFSEPLRFPQPAWLAGHSTPVIEALLEDQSDEARRLYRRYLADEVRAMRPDSSRAPAWRAFDRALYEALTGRRWEDRDR